MKDYPMFWVNLLFSIGIVLGILTTIIVDMRLKPMQVESEADKSIILQTMQTFSNFIDTKDPNTKGHSTRVAYYSKELAKKLKLPARDVELIYYIALMHDIGKIYIPDEILNKPGRLTPDERAIIETHAAKGAEILKDFTAIAGIADGARYHHEHYDGTGYPMGLAGEQIPYLARIICVADSYDAMSSDRCYRPRLKKDEIIEELKKNSGTQFDPEVVECMLKLIDSEGFYTGMLE
jgi:putative nucleotidyltransferase with HDIG domain